MSMENQGRSDQKLIPDYIAERKLSQQCPLSALSGTRLGIDAAHYIKILLSEPDSREPLVAATGGIPLALVHRIEADLRSLESFRIKPVFVFAGLPTSSRPPPKGMDELAKREMNLKNEAWTHYENGEVERAVLTLTQVRGGQWADWRDVVRSILRIFRHRMVEYLVAPYFEFAQVSVGFHSTRTQSLNDSSPTSTAIPRATSTRSIRRPRVSSGLSTD
jgi:hypothetical protein